MKKFTCFLAAILLLFTGRGDAQTINPDPNNSLYCPGKTYTFTVSLPIGNTWSTLNVYGSSVSATANGTAYNTVPAIVYGPPVNFTFPGGTTTQFKFDGGFQDDNTPQSFQVWYVVDGISYYVSFTFKKIESFLHPYVAVSRPVPSVSSITAPRCQVNNFNISFPNVQMASNIPGTPDVYGTVTEYQYLLPSGWSIGASSSTGSNWITSTNNATITSGLANGDGGYIYIRAVPPCVGTLTAGPAAQVAISRPAPTLGITSADGTNFICSSNTFNLSGVPAGATVSWALSDNTAATISAGGNSSSVVVSRVGSSNGTTNLTATVTDCNDSYTTLASLTVGTPAPSIISTTYTAGFHFTARASTIPGATYNWYLNGSLLASHSFNCSGDVECETTNRLQVEAVTSCGTSTRGPGNGVVIWIPCGGGGARSVNPQQTAQANPLLSEHPAISPNPSRGMITVSAGQTLSPGAKIYGIRVIDVLGKVRKLFHYSSGVTTTNLDISGLGNGIYTVQVYDKNTWISHQVLLQK